MLESLHEEYVTEGGVKAALEDFMYDLPKAAIAELKPLMKQKKGGVAQQVMRLASITAILKKHGVKKELMGFNTANLVNDYFDTFHGESVEVEGEQLSEQQQVIGKYRFTSFTEGSISGWLISVQGIGEVGFIQAPAKRNSKTTVAPHRVYKTKGQSEGDPKLVLTAYPDSGTRLVGGLVDNKEIRFAPRQLLKAVAMWMDKHGKTMTEEVEVSESKGVAFNVGSGAKRRIMSPNESVVGYYSIYAQYDSGKIELLLSKSDTVIGLEHSRMRRSNAKQIGRTGKLPKNFGGKPVTLDTLYQMIMAKVPDKSKAFGLQAQVMESMTEGTQFVEDGEIEVTESIDVQTAKRRFSNFQYKKSSKTVSGDNTEFVLHGVKETELKSIFGAPKSSGGMKQWSFEKDRPLDHQFTIEFDGSDAYINSSRKGNPTVRDHIKGVFGLMGLRVTTESIEEDGEIEMNESSYDAKVATAKQIAKRIKEEAQKRGVRVYPSGGDVLTATKEFTKGDLDAFMKAYRDCDMVLTYMRFTSRSNQWGCESAGFGVGAQECVKAGRVTINKSGGGGQLIIKALEGKLGQLL
jgi:hypothetical protein